MSVLSAGPKLLERLLALLAWIQEVVTCGVCHGAAAALAAAHLRLQPGVDLRAMAPGSPSRVDVPEDIVVGRLIADFGVATNAIAMVVNIEQVIKDTPH